jgi:hypothetical protein
MKHCEAYVNLVSKPDEIQLSPPRRKFHKRGKFIAHFPVEKKNILGLESSPRHWIQPPMFPAPVLPTACCKEKTPDRATFAPLEIECPNL